MKTKKTLKLLFRCNLVFFTNIEIPQSLKILTFVSFVFYSSQTHLDFSISIICVFFLLVCLFHFSGAFHFEIEVHSFDNSQALFIVPC